MLTNLLRDRVIIQLRRATQTATGETVVWVPVVSRYCRVVPLDAAARVVYQQLQSQATHRVIFRGSISLSLGNNRLLHGSKIYEPVEPVQTLDNKTSVIMVKEVQ